MRSSLNIRELDEQAPELFTHFDRKFANLMQRLSGKESPELVLAARLVSRHTGNGNVCLHISSIAGKKISEILGETAPDNGFKLYGEEAWMKKLRKSSVIGMPGDFKPLILDDCGRLYLHRYWQYEQKLSENIKARLLQEYNIDTDILKESISRLFTNQSGNNDEQIFASISAVLKGFCIITGGPGTGKTSIILKIIALLLDQLEGGSSLKIALAAPTGKAAARLNESMKNARNLPGISDDIKKNIPDESFTIHRLLGPVRGSPYFRYNSGNPMPYDVVIVDESSMADLALTAKLFEAVPLNSRLMLIGDKDQLASVEAGSVLGDICDTGNDHYYSKKFIGEIQKIYPACVKEAKLVKTKKEPVIADSIVTLTRSFRFTGESGIGEISRAIKKGEADKVINILKSDIFEDISLMYGNGYQSLIPALNMKIIEGYSPYLAAESPEESFKLFSNFTVLCALRKGLYGVEHINSLIEDMLFKNKLITGSSKWYNNRPVMIMRNDYNNKLYNGDIGLMLADKKKDKTYFYATTTDGNLRTISPLKLPDHETVYAMTVHKSQGSEFDNVLLLLPDYISPVLTRELLYTAVTRARKKIEIWGNEDILCYMTANPTERTSGLRDALWRS